MSWYFISALKEIGVGKVAFVYVQIPYSTLVFDAANFHYVVAVEACCFKDWWATEKILSIIDECPFNVGEFLASAIAVISTCYRNQSLNMASRFAFFLNLHVLIGLALATQQRDIRSHAIRDLGNAPDPSTGFSVNPNLNISNPLNATGKVYNPDGTYNVTTSYFSYVMCNDKQISELNEAIEDAVSLAANALLQPDLKRDASGRIDFTSLAAIEYFGPPSLNQPFQ